MKFYTDKLKDKIGNINFVLCLDSGCLNYEQMWVTTSLRGMIHATLKCKVLEEGVHSGKGSGIIPDSFRVARKILSKLEDEDTGKIKSDKFYVPIPEERVIQAEGLSEIIGDEIYKEFPMVKGIKPTSDDIKELILNRTWRPQLTVTGASDLPECSIAGNVLRPQTSLKLSLRLPPSLDAIKALDDLKEILTKDPPYQAKVEAIMGSPNSGWDSPKLADWLSNSMENASKTFFKKPVGYLGEGGSIPFIYMLGRMFPDAQFCVTGVLGPLSNAHGPNEFLHIEFTKKLTCCVALILADHQKSK